MRIPSRAILGASAAFLAGCSAIDSIGGVACTLELRSTIVVSVTDARTGAPAASGATVIVRGGAVYDSVVVSTATPAATVAYMAWEDRVKKGRYSVEVRKPGYVSFLKTDVDVTGDACHSGGGPHLDVALRPAT
ncbi:MAG: carboxypeptidase-like regulatory domain-containing protein [Gemmatimonadaceae bacterium]